ncbi:hypothetical protein K7X08_005701 [Anisodus acutangulus]|uniref:Uncharacterized protein n=1 Tax=Anisodus acutangulus TaxID=402998 RepID=A0A9Q1LSX7_9SOLA|nr:hypothetical protein K7X08_005701 [Anisodus acutangulus]
MNIGINQPNALEAQWTFLGSTNDSYYLLGHELNKQYMAGIGIDGIHYVPMPSPQWINDQQTPQNYVEYLAEKMWSLRDGSPEEMSSMLLDLALKHQLRGHRILPKVLEERKLHCLTGVLYRTKQFSMQKNVKTC